MPLGWGLSGEPLRVLPRIAALTERPDVGNRVPACGEECVSIVNRHDVVAGRSDRRGPWPAAARADRVARNESQPLSSGMAQSQPARLGEGGLSRPTETALVAPFAAREVGAIGSAGERFDRVERQAWAVRRLTWMPRTARAGAVAGCVHIPGPRVMHHQLL
jgi:hypothetical protein